MRWLLIICVVLSGCASLEPKVIYKYKTEYVYVPETFRFYEPAPERYNADEVSVEQIIEMGFNLRTAYCNGRSRYKQLMRVCTFGEYILPDPSELECPDVSGVQKSSN